MRISDWSDVCSSDLIADDIPSVDRAIRPVYNWEFGPFELLDQLGADDVAARLMEESRAVPLLLQQAVEAGAFYRVKDGGPQELTVEGDYGKGEHGEGVLLRADVQPQGSALGKN